MKKPAVTTKKAAPKRTLTTLRLPSDLLKKISAIAQSEGRSRSNFIERELLRIAEEHRRK